MAPEAAPTPLLKNKLFWVGVLYFAEGFPLGVFYEIFPVYFRQQGVELRQIGVLSLLGLAWTLKFLWAPAIDYWRRHRRWMAAVDVAMGGAMIFFAMQSGYGPSVWVAIGLFTMLSATNDIAIDGYTIELLSKGELGLANGIRIGMYRVGMLASGVVLMASDALGWSGAFVCAAVIFFGLAAVSLTAPPERSIVVPRASFAAEVAALARSPFALAVIAGFALGVVWLVNGATNWSARVEGFWAWAVGGALALAALVALAGRARAPAGPEATVSASTAAPAAGDNGDALTGGIVFGALMELLRRPGIAPVLLFILIFKLPDAAMGFMVKPFWVDSGFTAAQIGLVSVNIGLVLSIAGGVAGGWITDRIGILHALWILGLVQAASNLGYWAAAIVLPPVATGALVPAGHQAILYSASALESFTGGLGTAAFLAFLMAIVRKDRAATEYALLSSVFALSRSVAGWAGGLGAQEMGYANWFLLTFFFVFPAFLLLPWVRGMLDRQTGRSAPA
ncbi:Anhydromuropeptide permease [Burkholderiales bacterium]|nr:Anhydromuropeptide permease [Burkholderiales bacterium]